MIGLVLEGGGMRGIYTAAVLDLFLEEKIEIQYVVGISAGANVGCSYVSKQKYRSKRILTQWSQDKRFIGLYSVLKQRSFFGMDFLFDELPNNLDPFDYETFYNSETTFKSGVTNIFTGNATYYEKREFEPLAYMDGVLRASSSLPIISSAVEINHRKFLDGTVADPIPIQQSIKDGNQYHVIVLTKHEGYDQALSTMDRVLINMAKMKYPKMKESLELANRRYNDRLQDIRKLQESGEAFVFRPAKQYLESRYTKDPMQLTKAYEEAYEDALGQMTAFKQWLEKCQKSVSVPMTSKE